MAMQHGTETHMHDESSLISIFLISPSMCRSIPVELFIVFHHFSGLWVIAQEKECIAASKAHVSPMHRAMGTKGKARGF
jgi:hypothetical protein